MHLLKIYILKSNFVVILFLGYKYIKIANRFNETYDLLDQLMKHFTQLKSFTDFFTVLQSFHFEKCKEQTVLVVNFF